MLITDGHLPYPYGRELTGYEVPSLADTLTKAKAAGVEALVPPYKTGEGEAIVVQFPGGYIAEIHAAVQEAGREQVTSEEDWRRANAALGLKTKRYMSTNDGHFDVYVFCEPDWCRKPNQSLPPNLQHQHECITCFARKMTGVFSRTRPCERIFGIPSNTSVCDLVATTGSYPSAAKLARFGNRSETTTGANSLS